MAYWLMKSEPDTYSIDDLARDGRAPWEGVRNFQARNNLRAMKVGDLAFFYHSNAQPPGVAGICRIVAEAYPDDTQFDPSSPYHDPKSARERPRWYRPDVEFVRKLDRLVTLPEMREIPDLKDMELLRRSRLSVQRVAAEEWETILRLSESP